MFLRVSTNTQTLNIKYSKENNSRKQAKCNKKKLIISERKQI